MVTLFSLGGLASLAAVAGSPLGLLIAWIGSSLKNGTAKWLAIGVGLALMVGTVVGVTVWIERLKSDRAAYRVLKVEVDGLRGRYGCGARGLDACLTARDLAAAAAQRDALANMQTEAAQAQAALDALSERLREETRDTRAFIDREAVAGDGPVPKVLLDTWARARAARGLK